MLQESSSEDESSSEMDSEEEREERVARQKEIREKRVKAAQESGSRDNLRSTTFKYSLTQNKQDITDVARDQMSGAWQRVGEDHRYVATPMYGGYATATPAPVTGLQLQPGINRPASFYLNMGYALPAYECWGVPILFGFYPLPVCYTRTFKGNNSSKIETLRYDILPATIGGFMFGLVFAMVSRDAVARRLRY